jgi:hypothetical protein
MAVGSTNSPGANLNITGDGDGLEGVEGTAAVVQEVEQRRSSCEGFRNKTSLHYSL